MATPTLTRHRLPGSLGDILVDVRTGDRRNARPAVVIMHGFKGFKDWGMFPLIAERLARAGFSAVSFNVSGSGVDDAGEFSRPVQFGRNTYTAELQDLTRVLDATRAGIPLELPPAAGLGLLGHSRGGGMAILAAARDPEVKAQATWAAIGSVDRWSDAAKAGWRSRGFVTIHNARTGQDIPLTTDVLDDIDRHAGGSLDIGAAAARIRVPWLILHGENDESVDLQDARDLAARSGPGTRLVIVPGAGHTFGATHPMQQHPPQLEYVFEETTRFFSGNL